MNPGEAKTADIPADKEFNYPDPKGFSKSFGFFICDGFTAVIKSHL
jgi:hypothetical protein